MNDDITHLEHDIARTRARLDQTIDRLQDRLSVSGIVDDLLGQTRYRYGSAFDSALGVIRRNPVPVMLVAVGVGWLIHRMTREPRISRTHAVYSDGRDAAAPNVAVPVTVTGVEPLDAPPLPGAVETHPMPDHVDLRRTPSPRL
jgi:uncharacterized protein DUF3618